MARALAERPDGLPPGVSADVVRVAPRNGPAVDDDGAGPPRRRPRRGFA
nr:hypothetical protein [Halogeometricum sp. CBA1124]